MPNSESLNSTITRITNEYAKSSNEVFGGHSLANYIRHEFANSIKNALGDLSEKFVVKTSAGNGNWATIPWGAIFDPSITESATKGFYVVYLFSDYSPIVHLSLNQGATSLLTEFGSVGYEILSDRAEVMRARLVDYKDKLPIHHIDFKSNQRLPRGYALGHSLGIDYYPTTLPDNERLINDLHLILEAYSALNFRGGIDTSEQLEKADEDDEGISIRFTSIEEIRRYKAHRKIDRQSGVSKKVKSHHGTTCMVCGFNFYEVYGEVGKGFIEAHHKVPLSNLAEGSSQRYDLVEDFAVLCSNCHRMIHRMDDPSDVDFLKKLVLKRRKKSIRT